jgi:hypothetical protein
VLQSASHDIPFRESYAFLILHTSLGARIAHSAQRQAKGVPIQSASHDIPFRESYAFLILHTSLGARIAHSAQRQAKGVPISGKGKIFSLFQNCPDQL